MAINGNAKGHYGNDNGNNGNNNANNHGHKLAIINGPQCQRLWPYMAINTGQ